MSVLERSGVEIDSVGHDRLRVKFKCADGHIFGGIFKKNLLPDIINELQEIYLKK